MKEIFIDKNDPQFNKPKAFYILVFSVFVFGGLIAYLFVPAEQKIVQVPVEKIKFVDRVVETKVEVPVEVIKYVDRVVEKKVEVPVEKAVYRNQQNNSPENQNWRYLEIGMSTEQVRRLLGDPVGTSSYSFCTYWDYARYVSMKKYTLGWVRFDKNGRVERWLEP